MLHRLQLQYGDEMPAPLFFRLGSQRSAVTNCVGMLEFTAPEGCVVVPIWVMQNLGVDEQTMVSVEALDLPAGRYAKVQPQTSEFLEMEDPKRAYVMILSPCISIHMLYFFDAAMTLCSRSFVLDTHGCVLICI